MLHVKDKEDLECSKTGKQTLYTKETSKGLSVIFSAVNIIGQKRVEQCTQIIGRKKEREKERKNPANQKCSTKQSYLLELNRK